MLDPEYQNDADYKEAIELYCSCAVDAARNKLPRTDIEKLLGVWQQFKGDEKTIDSAFETLLDPIIKECLQQSGL